MAYTLNTGHALYSNLVELIGVEAGALVSLKTARTFTKHAEASYVTGGTYGEAFRSVGGGFTVKGASFTPVVSINTVANPDATLVVVVNSTSPTGGGSLRHFVSSTVTAAGAFTIGQTSAGLVTSLENSTTLRVTGTADLDTPSVAHMLAAVKIGETAHKVYVDGVFDIDSATRIAYNTSTGANWDYIGGATGQGSVAADFVWIAWFNKALSEAELDDLYSSLGANNQFGLIQSPGTTIAGNFSAATASGFAASIVAATIISCALGSADASGYQATVNVGSGTTINAALGTATASGFTASVAVAGTGTIVTEPLKNPSGTLLASQTGATAFVYNVSTGALVVAKTGQTTDVDGVMTISDALIVSATQYRVVVVLSGGAEGLAKYTAS